MWTWRLHFLKNYAILKNYFPFTVITKCWLYSLCCTVHSWVHLTPFLSYLYYSFPHSSLVTASLFSVSVDLLFFFLIFTSLLYSVCVCSVVSDSCNPVDTACQTPLSMGFSRQEYWSGLLCPPPGDLPHPGIEPGLLRCRILYQLSHQGIPILLNFT